MRAMTENEMEPGRVERGVQLECEAAGDGRYKVTGGDSVHWVDLESCDQPRCDCGDYLWRDAVCKHIIAARLREGDEQTIGKLGALVRSLRDQMSEKEEVLRKATAA